MSRYTISDIYFIQSETWTTRFSGKLELGLIGELVIKFLEDYKSSFTGHAWKKCHLIDFLPGYFWRIVCNLLEFLRSFIVCICWEAVKNYLPILSRAIHNQNKIMTEAMLFVFLLYIVYYFDCSASLSLSKNKKINKKKWLWCLSLPAVLATALFTIPCLGWIALPEVLPWFCCLFNSP